MESLEIKNENGLTKVTIDGVEVNGIKSVRFEHEVGNIPTLNLEIYIIEQAGIKDIEHKVIMYEGELQEYQVKLIK